MYISITTSEDKTEGTDLPKEEEEGCVWGGGINKNSKFVRKKVATEEFKYEVWIEYLASHVCQK